MSWHCTARYGLSVAALVALTGCDEIEDAYMKARFEGTTSIISWCTQRNVEQARILRLDVRTLCANRHSKIISHTNLDGNGSFLCFSSDQTSVFNGSIRNNTNYVITSLSVGVHFTENGRRIYSRFSDVWIPPGEGSFSVWFPDPIPCSDVKRMVNGQWPYDWSWSFLKGVAVTVR